MKLIARLPATQMTHILTLVAIVLNVMSCVADDFVASTSLESRSWLSLGVEMDANSRYIWRGLLVQDNVVVQPTIWLSANHTSLSVWSNHPISQDNFQSFDEVDISLSQQAGLKSISGHFSVQLYHYPLSIDPSTTLEAAGLINIPLTLLDVGWRNSIDLLQYSGAYDCEFMLSRDLDVSSSLGLTVYSSLGWGSAKFNSTYFETARAGFSFIGSGIESRLNLTPSFQASLHFEDYHRLLSLHDGHNGRNIGNVGLTFSKEF